MRPLSYRESLGASFGLHLAVVLFVRLMLTAPGPAPIEIDLSTPFFGTGPAKLGAPKRLDPKAKAVAALPAETPIAPPPVATPPPQEFTTGSQKKAVEAPVAPPPTPGGSIDGPGTSPLTGGHGPGADYGTPNGRGDGGAPLMQGPRLLNRDEVLANLRRFYPERERIAGREGVVRVKLHIGADGSIVEVGVDRSAGPLFDAAAQQVGRLMRFAPAIGRGGNPVPVRLPQEMVFKLED